MPESIAPISLQMTRRLASRYAAPMCVTPERAQWAARACLRLLKGELPGEILDSLPGSITTIEDEDELFEIGPNGSYDWERHGHLAIVDVRGPISYDANIWSWLFRDCMAPWLVNTIDEVAADSGVSVAMFRINSPGGDSYAMPSLLRAVEGLRAAGKRTIAMASPMACSLAYALAAGCDEIASEPMGDIGSIGTWQVIYDYSRMFAEEGIEPRLITTGVHKATGLAGMPISDEQLVPFEEGVAEVQADFVAHVAAHRPLTPEQITGFGGRSFTPRRALANGLIDRITTMDDLLAELAGTDPEHASTGGTTMPGVTSKKKRTPASLRDAAGTTSKPKSEDDLVDEDEPAMAEDGTGETGEEDQATGDEPTTAAELEEKYPDLVAEIREDERSKSADGTNDEQPASFTQLDRMFSSKPGGDAIITQAQRDRLSMASAMAKYTQSLESSVAAVTERAQVAEEKLSTLVGGEKPVTATATPAGDDSLAAWVTRTASERNITPAQALAAAVKEAPVLHAAWRAQGRPSIPGVPDGRKGK